MTTNDHSKRKHSLFAASSASRWLTCPGSVRLSLKAPPQKSSFYANEGTEAHECLEFIVKRYSNLRAAEKQALKKWSEEMVSHAVASAATVFELKPSKKAKLLVETRVFLKSISTKLFGTVDYAWVDPDGELVVCDYKYGAGVPVLPVDTETGEPNPQLMYYALGLAEKFNYQFDRVRLAVIQPRVWAEGESALSDGIVTIKALKDFREKIKRAIVEAKKPNAPLSPSESACRWCPAASFCPAISTAQMDSVGIHFEVEKGLTKLPDVQALTAGTIGKVLDAAELLKVWIQNVESRAFQLASDGEKIDGRKLVQKRAIRSWLPEAEEQAEKRLGSSAFQRKLKSPAQLEKELKKEGKEFSKEFATRVSSGYTLAKASDSRAEVTSTLEFETDV